MTRKKVELKFITNYSKRRATYKKRKTGLMKKIEELSVLCGIDACAIIYVPENPEPEIWPSEVGVQEVISRFRGMSELEQNRKNMSQESFLKKCIVKSQKQLKNLREENRKIELSLNLAQYFFNGLNFLDDSNMADLNDITKLIDQNLKEIEARINLMQAPEVTPAVVENGGETMIQGEEAVANHVQGSENMNNDVGRAEMLPLEHANVPSGWLNSFIR